ncbi:MAG TPA: FAD-dependent oxidoreductase, partial [Nitrososphaeraceae archaeon]|nr:FAD-dependent oxidoreductase [Nitrososphaeraceae archaeon]
MISVREVGFRTNTIKGEVIISTRPLKLQLQLLDKIRHEGTDIMSFKFARNDDQQQANYLNNKAGQYAVMDLGTKEDPEGPVRSFTIASSPTEEFIMISTRIRDTPFKKKLANLQLGSLVKITAPLGKFVLPDDDNSKSAVFLSGGIGVTPFRSMIKYATDKKSSIKIMMCDSNRDKKNILYKTLFDECMTVNRNLKVIYTITGNGHDRSSSYPDIVDDEWRQERGHINKAMLTKYMTNNELENSVFYICGPP